LVEESRFRFLTPFLEPDNFDEEWSDLGPGDDDLQELQSAIREAGVGSGCQPLFFVFLLSPSLL